MANKVEDLDEEFKKTDIYKYQQEHKPVEKPIKLKIANEIEQFINFILGDNKW